MEDIRKIVTGSLDRIGASDPLDHLNGLTELDNLMRVSTEGILNGIATVDMEHRIDEFTDKMEARKLDIFYSNSNDDGTSAGSGGDITTVSGTFEKSSTAEYLKFKNEFLKLAKEGKLTFQSSSIDDVEHDLVCLAMIQFVLYLRVAKANITGSWGFGTKDHGKGIGYVSRHKYGVAVDISRINGTHIKTKGHKNVKKLADALAAVAHKEDHNDFHEILAPKHFCDLMHDRGFKSPWQAPGHADHLHFAIPKSYGLKNPGYSKYGPHAYDRECDPGIGDQFYMSWIFKSFEHYESIRDGKVSATTTGNGVTSAKGSPMDITNGYAVSASELKSILAKIKNGDRIAPYADQISAAGIKYGVNPLFSIAMSAHETGWWTSHAFKEHNNIGGLSKAGHHYAGADVKAFSPHDIHTVNARWCSKHKRYEGRWEEFNTIGDSFQAKMWLIRKFYLDEKQHTIYDILAGYVVSNGKRTHGYAPGSDGNDPKAYERQVIKNMRDFCKKINLDPDKKRTSSTTSKHTNANDPRYRRVV
jgi:hypothetical protein